MTALLLLLIFTAQISLVAGQIFLKHGMNFTNKEELSYGRVIPNMIAGITALTLWFLLWAGLMQKLDLSYLYPFEGMSPLLLVIAARLILKERLGTKSWVGVGLISVGTFIVGMS